MKNLKSAPLIITHPGTVTELQDKHNKKHHKHVVMLFVLPEALGVLAQVPLIVGGSLLHH